MFSLQISNMWLEASWSSWKIIQEDVQFSYDNKFLHNAISDELRKHQDPKLRYGGLRLFLNRRGKKSCSFAPSYSQYMEDCWKFISNLNAINIYYCRQDHHLDFQPSQIEQFWRNAFMGRPLGKCRLRFLIL